MPIITPTAGITNKFVNNAIIESLQNGNEKRQRFDSPKKELIMGLVETSKWKCAYLSTQ